MRTSRFRQRFFLPLIAAALVLPGGAVCRAQQAAAPPPPPPSEGLDPATAPATSTAPPSVVAAPQTPPAGTATPGSATTAAPPPAPSEGLDPATAPASSTSGAMPGMAATPPTAAPAAPSESGTGSDTPAPAVAETDTGGAGTSVSDVFKLDFMRRALWVGLIISGICAYLGVYVVLRRVVFVGVALSQMSSAGVALSLFAALSPMVGSVITMLIGVALLSIRWGGRKIRQDAFIGIGYAVAAAAAILLVAKSPKGEGDLLQLLFGNILTVSPGEANMTVLALGGVLLFHLLFFKELLFVSFDPDTAAASGYSSRLWELLLYVSIGLTIAFAIHAVGVLLPFAALVIPAVTALLLTRRMGSALLVSMIAGMLPVPIGLYISFVSGLPSSETVVAVSFALLVLAGSFAFLRGRATSA